ncbi:galactosylceramide sulfotransferase-like isoform X1 [Artemia franciscana]|uniref:galactosylceramide sulfotransferase-like isoform X1 n=1 Tax=Artemia franciscana TaxID=6661 RepID=UPI0032DA5F4F
MALHTRWHQSTIKQALGGDPTFITTIREPAQLFESLYSYYNLYKFHGELTLYEFLDKLEDEDFKRKDDRFLQKIGRNQMLFDLGFPIEDFDNEEKVKKFVEEVEQNFDLVMVTDKMEESIVLLKHLLCWDYRDLVFLKRNSRAKNKIQKLSVDQTNKLRRWLKADNYLYTKLREVFDKKVEKFGYKKMEEEKQKLSSVMNQIMEGCLSGEKNLHGKILFEELKKSAGCRLYALGEHIFLDEITKAQWKRADKVALQSLGLR